MTDLVINKVLKLFKSGLKIQMFTACFTLIVRVCFPIVLLLAFSLIFYFTSMSFVCKCSRKCCKKYICFGLLSQRCVFSRFVGIFLSVGLPCSYFLYTFYIN